MSQFHLFLLRSSYENEVTVYVSVNNVACVPLNKSTLLSSCIIFEPKGRTSDCKAFTKHILTSRIKCVLMNVSICFRLQRERLAAGEQTPVQEAPLFSGALCPPHQGQVLGVLSSERCPRTTATLDTTLRSTTARLPPSSV